ncbi:MAG: SulP family inorganic anion transporter [Verrucomicrobia bacterium]|nr:SulP family inorganic anion transporter [Verrucomicrobiota bacterium]MDA1065863.1 SulP family inorganic anion transporter [Verrucomicrobiota bacterium]
MQNRKRGKLARRVRVAGNAVREGFKRNALELFPIKKELQRYNAQKGLGDLRAGFNVALLAFPQGMAYALIGGLPVQYGIYCAALASIFGPLFSGSRFIALGPTNATSVMLMSTIGGMVLISDKLEAMPTLLLLVAMFLILGALLGVANLIQYISRSVVTGYITAAAVLIIANQLDSVMGFEIQGESTFISVLEKTFKSVDLVNWPSVALGVITLALFLFLVKKQPLLPNVAITLATMSLVGVLFNNNGYGLVLLDQVPMGVLPVSLPIPRFDLIDQLAPGALAIAFLAILEGSSIGKSLAARAGGRINSNQEMLGMGAANLASAFVSGMPASGSLTRSVLNYTSGSKTALSHILSGFLCLAGVLSLGPLIGYIPRAALAVVVIGVGISLINKHQIRIVTKSTKTDALVFFVTLVSGLLFKLDFAIYLGTGTSIVLFLRKVSMPELIEYTFNDEGNLTELTHKNNRAEEHISIVHVEGELFFGAAELFRDQIRIVSEEPNLKVIILKMRNAHHLDATTMMALEELILYIRERGRRLIVSGARRDVYKVFRDSGILSVVGRKNFFMDHVSNPNLSTANALRRAQEIIGKKSAEIRIYTDPNKSKDRN